MIVVSTESEKKSGAYFPQAYLTDMLRFVSGHSDKIDIITYADLLWDGDYDYLKGYPREKKNWLDAVKSGQANPLKAQLLIQYDLDSRPERAMSALSHAAHQSVPANIMCFAHRVDRKHLKASDELRYTDYELDVPLLQSLQAKGFLIGYHSNCYERSHHKLDKARDIMGEDIETLRQQFTVDFYTAHGGIPDDKGKNNRDITPHQEIADQVRWVHNGATPFFNKQFSDGGHNSPKRDPAGRDIRDFFEQMKPGGRYRILLHPQYYDVSFTPSKRYSGTAWYDQMVADLAANPEFDIWGKVKLSEDFTPVQEPDQDDIASSPVIPTPIKEPILSIERWRWFAAYLPDPIVRFALKLLGLFRK